MMVKNLKAEQEYEFECNISEEYKTYENHDEWGCAFIWLEDIGVEYNFSIDEGESYCAIYKMIFNKEEDYMETDYDTFIHYDIDFNNENWKGELENAMCKVIIEFFNL